MTRAPDGLSWPLWALLRLRRALAPLSPSRGARSATTAPDKANVDALERDLAHALHQKRPHSDNEKYDGTEDDE